MGIIIFPSTSGGGGSPNAVLNNQNNTYSTGVQNFSSATDLILPSGAVASAGEIGYDAATGRLRYYDGIGAAVRNVAFIPVGGGFLYSNGSSLIIFPRYAPLGAGTPVTAGVETVCNTQVIAASEWAVGDIIQIACHWNKASASAGQMTNRIYIGTTQVSTITTGATETSLFQEVWLRVNSTSSWTSFARTMRQNNSVAGTAIAGTSDLTAGFNIEFRAISSDGTAVNITGATIELSR